MPKRIAERHLKKPSPPLTAREQLALLELLKAWPDGRIPKACSKSPLTLLSHVRLSAEDFKSLMSKLSAADLVESRRDYLQLRRWEVL
jgi:hypothetical protein